MENIILNSDYKINHENQTYSGYYLFDSLLVKKNGKWKYILALFYLKLNTIVSRELADSQSVETVYKFLEKSLRNQNKNCIITDLKNEYRFAIDKLQIKQQFCTFHLKQLINREIYNYIKQINPNEMEIEIIYDYKELFFNIINENSIIEVKEKRN